MALPARGVPIERSTPLGRGLWGASVRHSFLLRQVGLTKLATKNLGVSSRFANIIVLLNRALSMESQKQGFCSLCKRHTLHVREVERVNHVAHLLFSIFCMGLWIPVWFLLAAFPTRHPFRCSVCGQLEGGLTPQERAAEERRRAIASQARRDELQKTVKAAGAVGATFLVTILSAVGRIVSTAGKQISSALLQVNKTLRVLAGKDDFMYRFYQTLFAAAVVSIGIAATTLINFGHRAVSPRHVARTNSDFLSPDERAQRADANAFLGFTEVELIKRLGEPLSVNEHGGPEGPYRLLQFDRTEGKETFFVIFADDGRVASGSYRGTPTTVAN